MEADTQRELSDKFRADAPDSAPSSNYREVLIRRSEAFGDRSDGNGAHGRDRQDKRCKTWSKDDEKGGGSNYDTQPRATFQIYHQSDYQQRGLKGQDGCVQA